MARIVRTSDKHLEDTDSNPGWISFFFSLFNVLSENKISFNCKWCLCLLDNSPMDAPSHPQWVVLVLSNVQVDVTSFLGPHPACHMFCKWLEAGGRGLGTRLHLWTAHYVTSCHSVRCAIILMCLFVAKETGGRGLRQSLIWYVSHANATIQLNVHGEWMEGGRK